MLTSARLRRRIFCLLYVLCILSALALCLASCSTARHVATTTHSDISTTHQADTLAHHAMADTSRTALHLRDTLLLRDTLRVSYLSRGDTVYVDRYRTRSLIQRITLHDTVFRSLTDTLHLATTEQETSATMQSSKSTKRGGGSPWPFVLFLLLAAAYVVCNVISKK